MIYLQMLLASSLAVAIFGTVIISVNDGWSGNYLVVVVSGGIAIIFTIILIILKRSDDINRELGYEDSRNTWGD